MKENDDWLKKGIYLGLIFFICVFLVKPIGVSTQFSVLSGIFHKAIKEDIIFIDDNLNFGYASSNEYYNKNEGKLAENIINPWNYDFIFVLFIPIGAFLAAYTNRKVVTNLSIDKSNKKNKYQILNYIPSFFGGFILLFSARMADGCTSGHMMSGIMQSSLSGYIFAISVFIVAIPTAILTNKLKNKGIKDV